MTAPVVEIIVSADATTSRAIVQATAEGLPASAIVQLVDRATPRADVVVTVRWADESEHKATLQVSTRDGRETQRLLIFGAVDPDRERGRALGFAIAAMIPDDVRGVEEPKSPATIEAPPPAHHAPEADRRAPSIADAKVWLDASAQGSTGLVGSASSVGGAIAVRTLLRPFELHLGGAMRAGRVVEADASSLLFRGGGGVGFYTVAFDPRVTLGGRTGLVVFHHSLRRAEAESAAVTGTHTLLGAELMVDGSLAFSSGLAVVAAIGSEVAFGTTRVLVGAARVAVIPAVRPVAELGVRMAF